MSRSVTYSGKHRQETYRIKFLTCVPDCAMLLHMADLLTTAQAAARLRTSISTVNYRVRVGDLKVAQKLPGETGAYLFDPKVIDAFAAARASKRERRSA